MLLLLLACSDSRTLSVAVADVWGKPVMDATVVLEGVVERYHTDTAGKFQIDVDDPVNRVMVGKSGYIKDFVVTEPPLEDDQDYPPLAFQLYPEPEMPGFYGVGREGYIHLQARHIRIVGTDVEHFAGLKDIPDEKMVAGPARFVFSSTLRASELSQMNLHLTRLKFIEKVPMKVPMKGLLGRDAATVNLWVADGDVPFDLKALQSRDDYLISSRDPLTEGMYAFHSQDVLNEEDERVLMNLPKERQVAFPFGVD